MMASEAFNLPDAARESIARAIHEEYRANQADRKPADDPPMSEWDGLPEDLRESNRRQAGDIFNKLRAIGCKVREVGEDRTPELISFTHAEIERMSKMEHDRWVAERRADGWTLGDRDIPSKTTPHLVSWEELSEDIREWDREAVRKIPHLLAQVGFEIRRDG